MNKEALKEASIDDEKHKRNMIEAYQRGSTSKSHFNVQRSSVPRKIFNHQIIN